jgi:hypothetical protein
MQPGQNSAGANAQIDQAVRVETKERFGDQQNAGPYNADSLRLKTAAPGSLAVSAKRISAGTLVLSSFSEQPSRICDQFSRL